MPLRMIYHLSLFTAGLSLGIFYILSHGWLAMQPTRCGSWLSSFPRNLAAGRLLMLAATIWYVILVSHLDLMEYSPHRTKFIIAGIVLACLTSHFVREFLAVRALGVLLILLAQVLLDAAFPCQETSRLVLTLTAYAYAVTGMTFVGAPYLLRDALACLTSRPQRCRWAGFGGAAFGLILIVLAATCWS